MVLSHFVWVNNLHSSFLLPHVLLAGYPRLKISTSLVVRDLDGLTIRGIRELLNDTMETFWEDETDF